MATSSEIARAHISLMVKMPGVQKDIGRQLGSVDTGSIGTQMGRKLSASAGAGFDMRALGRKFEQAGEAIAGVGSQLTRKITAPATIAAGAVAGVTAALGWGRLASLDTAQAQLRGLGYEAQDVERISAQVTSAIATGMTTMAEGTAIAAGALAAGVDEGAELERYIKLVGDAAVGANRPVNEMAQIFNRVQGQGKLMTQELNMIEDGLPGFAATMAESMGVSQEEFRKMVTAGEISSDQFMDVMEGFAGGMAEEYANSWDGMVANTKSFIGIIGENILKGVFQDSKKELGNFTEFLQSEEVITWAQEFGATVTEWFGKVVDVVKGVIDWWNNLSPAMQKFIGIFAGVMVVAGPVLVVVGKIAAGIGALIKVASTIFAVIKGGVAIFKMLNAVMMVNPIGIIITLVALLVTALIWFFTETELGQEIWANFTQWLGEAWQNIVDFGIGLWEGLGQFFTDLWENIKGFFSAAVDWIVDMFMNWTVYGLIIKNWDAIAQFFVDTWNNITGFIAGAIEFVKLVIAVGIGIIRKTWTDVWNGIKSFFGGIWDWIVNLIRSRIELFKLIFSTGVNIVRSVWENVWNTIRNVFSTVWGRIKSTLDTMIGFIKTKPKQAFEAARDAIGKAWKGIQELARKPVKFVVETVINGLIGTINKIPGVNLKKISLPKGFAEGGWTGPGGKYDPAGLVHADEFVVSKAARKRFEANHPGALDHINKTGALPGFAKGGLVHPLPGGQLTAGWLGYPGHRALDFAKAAGSRVRAAGAGTVRSAGWNNQGLGYNVDINHANGLVTRYSHMLANLAVRAGQAVKRSQTIGYVGSTGNSTGPHLHYEVHKGYQNRVNPTPYLSGGGEAGSEGFGILDGLMDWAVGKFKDNFPGSDMWIDMASGLMKETVSGVVKNVTGLLSHGGPTLYDNGGWLDPGTHLVQNKTGRPEPILTGAQWDAMKQGRGDVYVQNPFTGEYLLAKVDERADRAVDVFADQQLVAHRQSQWR